MNTGYVQRDYNVKHRISKAKETRKTFLIMQMKIKNLIEETSSSLKQRRTASHFLITSRMVRFLHVFCRCFSRLFVICWCGGSHGTALIAFGLSKSQWWRLQYLLLSRYLSSIKVLQLSSFLHSFTDSQQYKSREFRTGKVVYTWYSS